MKNGLLTTWMYPNAGPQALAATRAASNYTMLLMGLYDDQVIHDFPVDITDDPESLIKRLRSCVPVA